MTKLVYLSFFLFTFFYAPKPHVRKVDYSLQVDYRLTYLPDSNNNEFKEEEMELLVNPDESVFRAKKRGVLDSVLQASLEGKSSTNNFGLIRANQTPINYYIYKTADSIITQEDYQLGFNKEQFYIEKKIFDWQISPDTITIGGMKCQQATTDFGGRKWIAWFAPEVPINDGPYKFRGLPGLIVKVYDSKEQWSFNLRSLRKIQRKVTVKFDRNDPPDFMQKKEVFANKKYYIRNRMKIEEASGLVRPKDEKSRRSGLERDRKRAEQDNNWIELYDAIVH